MQREKERGLSGTFKTGGLERRLRTDSTLFALRQPLTMHLEKISPPLRNTTCALSIGVTAC
jgi:hypothetical protein